jgi:hypothetical protein
MKYLKKFESYSNHRYHTEILDDLLDVVLPILDEYGIVEWSDRLLDDRVPGEPMSPNWRFGYANDNRHMKDSLDNINISCIPSFKIGQELLHKLQNSKSRIEKMIGRNVVIETSNSIQSDTEKHQYRKMMKQHDQDGHPYIQISILPEGEKHDDIRYK